MWKTVLLDVDGMLLDSNAAYAHAWREAFAVYDNPADLLEHWDESPLAQRQAAIR